jgi:hypothetical protein
MILNSLNLLVKFKLKIEEEVNKTSKSQSFVKNMESFVNNPVYFK